MNWLTNIHVIILIVITGGSCNNMNDMLFKDYIESNDINVVLLVSCETDDELTKVVQSIKDLQHRGIWTNVWDISTEVASNNQFFDRYSSPPGVVIDLQCNRTKSFLAEMSKRVLFHQQRKWLMWSESRDEAFDYLSNENVNFDAEIIVAIPSRQGLDYGIYEAYNPSYRRGGRLNITAMGQWNKVTGWNVSSQTKIERRRNLNGITFPTVVPVL